MLLGPLSLTLRARGVDYPGVTKIIQVGAPLNRDIYIHRIGRTGRAGKSGDATLILAPFEKTFLDQLTDIPIKDHELPASEIEVGLREQKVLTGAQKIPPEGMVEETFSSLLGYCNLLFTPKRNLSLIVDLPKVKSWGTSIEQAMSEMENWTLAMGAPAIPRVSKTFLERIIGKPKAVGYNVKERRKHATGHRTRESHDDPSRFDGDNRGGYGRDSRRFGGDRSRSSNALKDRRGTRRYEMEKRKGVTRYEGNRIR
jgi:superfamily II DNA/RNA helicase